LTIHKEDNLAFRDGQRYVARLVRKQLPESLDVPVGWHLPDYWWSGGLGAEGCPVDGGTGATLVLTGRRGFKSGAGNLSQLEQAGAKVLVAPADVFNEGYGQVLEKVKASMSPHEGCSCCWCP